MTTGIALAPLVQWGWIAGPAIVGLALLALGVHRRARGMAWRAAILAVLVLTLINPRIVNERREAQPDVAVILIDRSGSQAVGKRVAQTDGAVAAIGETMSRFDDLEVRTIEAPSPDRAGAAADEAGTRLFDALARVMAETPQDRFAGAILITDGRVHDVPDSDTVPAGPLHILLSGAAGEKDRRLIIEKAPGYGIVGNPVTVAFRVEDSGAQGTPGTARVRLRRDGVDAGVVIVPIGRSEQHTITLDRAGQSVLELEVEAAPDELSTVNNRAAVSINGVRDRLRVLLVSGQPHAGERTWRNLLKSDPSVDLVHFTILRPPEKDDLTPLRELALIAFPIRELFDVKLGDFDLVVFDRYMVRDVLPPSYLRNIAEYVRDGGALLMAVGPEFAGLRSLYHTPLGDIMPGTPTGRILDQAFRPALTAEGRRHPVTMPLAAAGTGPERWGRWFRQIDVARRAGVAIMEGRGSTPLLVLDRLGEGRVAQFMSDHIWLWARGYDGGGPQAELLRRLAHWLMKEPDLEEESLRARVQDGRLVIERRSLSPEAITVTVTAPSGERRTVPLTVADGGVARATVAAPESGLYSVADGARAALAAAGALNPLEFADLRATERLLAPVAAATGGGLAWIGEGALPDVRRTRPGGDTAGRGWLGLRRNHAYVVTGLTQVSLLPPLLVLFLGLGTLIGAWLREGR